MRATYFTITQRAFNDFPNGFPLPKEWTITHAILDEVTSDIRICIISDSLPSWAEYKPGVKTIECELHLINKRKMNNGGIETDISLERKDE